MDPRSLRLRWEQTGRQTRKGGRNAGAHDALQQDDHLAQGLDRTPRFTDLEILVGRIVQITLRR